MTIRLFLCFVMISILPMHSQAQRDSSRILVSIEDAFKYSVQYLEVKGPKKSISVSVYALKEQTLDSDQQNLTKTTCQNFDQKGKLIFGKVVNFESGKEWGTEIIKYEGENYESLAYSSDSSYFKKEVWKRENKRHSFRHINYGVVENDTTEVEDEKYIRRHHGRLQIMKQTINRYNQRETTLAKYNRRHQPIEESYYSYGNQWLKKVWVYDTNYNLLADTTIYLRGGMPTTQSISIYDSSGNILEHIGIVFEFSSSNRRHTYKYDSNNHEIEWVQYLADGSLEMKGNNRYDSQGNLIERTTENQDGKVDFRAVYSYNNCDLLVKEAINNFGYDMKSERTYDWRDIDIHGNWLTVIECLNGVPKLITRREIEYY